MSDNELFSRTYSVSSGELLDALQQALASMPTVTLQRVDDSGQGIEFQTTLTPTSWGETMRATVDATGDDGAVLRVSGQPRVGAMSTPWGEEAHAAQIEQQLFAALEAALASSS